jgi:TRAP-type C4-dicarboxylate transport system permease small subunit
MWAILRRGLANFEEIGAGIGLLLVIGLVTFTIVNRYVLQRSGVWAPELAEMIFAWVVFLGASAASKRDMHISIDVLVRYFGPRTRALIQLFGDVVLVVFLAYVTYLSVKITISSHSRVSPVLRIPFSYVYGSAALAFGLMLIRRSIDLMRSLRGAHSQTP